MQLVTLTSDIGTTDHYAARLRGSLLCADGGVRIAELNLQLPPYDLSRGAFLFRQSFAAFPAESVHLVTLYDQLDANSEMVFFRHQAYTFVGPNNGFFSLVFPELQVPFFGRPFNDEPLYGQYATIVTQLAGGTTPDALGTPTKLRRGYLVQPIEQMSEIRATIVHVDRFGNVFTNLSRETFERIARDRSFELYFKRHHPLREVSEFYQQVPVGTPLCKFDSGVLEIATNSGDAATLLGLRVNDVVLVTFKNA